MPRGDGAGRVALGDEGRPEREQAVGLGAVGFGGRAEEQEEQGDHEDARRENSRRRGDPPSSETTAWAWATTGPASSASPGA